LKNLNFIKSLWELALSYILKKTKHVKICEDYLKFRFSFAFTYVMNEMLAKKRWEDKREW